MVFSSSSRRAIFVAVVVAVIAVLSKSVSASGVRGSMVSQPIPAWSRRQPSPNEQLAQVEAKLKQLGCKLKCTRGARILTAEKSQAAKLFVKFVHTAHAALEQPTNASLTHTNAIKEDVLFYIKDVWQKMAQFDVQMNVQRYAAIVDSMDFEARIKKLMTLFVEGPNHYARGLIGGPFTNSKCMSGVALAGAIDPTTGNALCIPVLGPVVPKVQCANFAMVPNSVLTTLSPAEMRNMCHQTRECDYIDYEQNGNVGLCVPKTASTVHMGAHERKTLKLWQHVRQMKIRMAMKMPPPSPAAIDRQMKNQSASNAASNVTEVVVSNPESPANVQLRKDCRRMHEARITAIEKIHLVVKSKRIECRDLKLEWKDEPERPHNCSDCQPPLKDSKKKTSYLSCERQIITLLTKKAEIQKDLSQCTAKLHKYKCDVVDTRIQCPQKPFCSAGEVDFFSRMSAGTTADCCNTYTCIQRGFGGNEFGEGLVTQPLPTSSKCPDFSSVSPLAALRKAKVSSTVLEWYEKLCVRVPGCMYLQETNTCV